MSSFTFMSDPSHGWLRVPLKDVFDLGIQDKISSFSYMKGNYVYLEEDQDAGFFIDAYEKKYGRKPVYKETSTDSRSRVRSYDRYDVDEATKLFSGEETSFQEEQIMKTDIKKILEGADPRELLIETQTLSCSSCSNYEVMAKKCKVAGAVSKAHSKEKMLRWVANPNVGNECSKYKGIESEYYKGDLKKSGAEKEIHGDPEHLINRGPQIINKGLMK